MFLYNFQSHSTILTTKNYYIIWMVLLPINDKSEDDDTNWAELGHIKFSHHTTSVVSLTTIFLAYFHDEFIYSTVTCSKFYPNTVEPLQWANILQQIWMYGKTPWLKLLGWSRHQITQNKTRMRDVNLEEIVISQWNKEQNIDVKFKCHCIYVNTICKLELQAK